MNQSLLILFFLSILLISWYLLFFRKKKRPPLPPFPKNWKKILKKNVRYYQNLSPEEQVRFEKEILEFFQDVKITGVETEVEDLDCLLVAASAVIPIFGFPEWHRYPHLDEVLLYPNTFNANNFQTKGKDRNVLGMVGWGYMNGKMILSKPALRLGFRQAGRSNVGIHEFVHLIDKADGAVDGIPEYFLERQYVIPWMDMIHQEIVAIKRKDSDINSYGATSETEFFAVAAEYFFQRPEAFSKKHPQLFGMLERIFNQDLNDDGIFGDSE